MGSAASDSGATLLGWCILISDQTIVPYIAEFGVDKRRTRLRCSLKLGRPGNSRLGVTAFPYGSTGAARLKAALEQGDALEWTDWVYEVSSDASC
jgi:hypothetical protein